MAAVAIRRPVAADSDLALAALIQACQRKPALEDRLLKTRELQPYFTSEDELAHLKKRNSTPGKDRARQVKAKKPKASKPQVPASPVALSVSQRVASKPAPAAPTPSKAVGIKLAAEGKQWAGPSSFISPKPEALPKPSLSLLRKAST